MATIPGNIYAPPGVYTRTLSDNPVVTALASVLIPSLIGTGNELLFQGSLEIARGSSSSVDQRVIQEDLAGRFVQSITDTGQIILGNANGSLNKVQVRNFPIVSGQGTGTTTNDRTAVQVKINGNLVVVLAVDGATGVVSLAQNVTADDVVNITYHFNRSDTNITDDVSGQVTKTDAEILGGIGKSTGETFSVIEGLNDVFSVTADKGVSVSIQLTEGDFTPSQIAALLNGQAPASLVVSVILNNEGKSVLLLTADNDIEIGEGTANSILGFSSGQKTARNKSFFTWQGPIVDGSDGGVITTDPSDVVVKVNGIQIIPTAVDGSLRTVTLPFAPAKTDTVSIQYYFNTWENTFDYLANVGVTEVTQAGVTPGRRDYVQGVDFILKDDRILWGTASVVGAGETSSNSTAFGPSQVSTTLVDYRNYLSPATPVVDTSVTPPVDSRKVFQMAFQPTTGNGRNSPLGADTFQAVSNDRIDLPTNRPDLVSVYWGYSLQDALNRGEVEVVKVDSSTSTVTLKDPIDPEASVWVTQYYNVLQDQAYTLTSQISGPAGVGTYAIQNSTGASLFGGSFTGKSSLLTGVTVNFPRGSELLPDLRFESGSKGPVEEVATIEFVTTQDSPAKYTIPGPGPYFIADGFSDSARLKVDGVDIAGASGVDVSDPSGTGVGFFASLVGDEVVYDAASGGATYEITSSDAGVSFTVDGVLISGTAVTGTGTLENYVDAINVGALASGVRYRGASRFTAPTTIALGEYDKISFQYSGSSSSLSGVQVVTLDPGVYASANSLASEINTKIGALPAPSQASLSVVVGTPVAGNNITLDGDILLGTAGVPAADEFNVDAQDQASLQVTIPGIVGPSNGDTFTLDDGSLTPPVLTANTTGGVLAADEFDARPETAAEGTVTIASSPQVPGTVITVGTIDYTATVGAVTPGDPTYQSDAGTTDAIAASLAAQINANATSAPLVTAVDVGSVVTITADTAGSAGNTIILTSSLAGDAAVSGAGTLEGGIDSDAAAISFAAVLTASGSFSGIADAAYLGANVVEVTADFVGFYGEAGNSLQGVTSNATEISLGGPLAVDFTGGEDHPAKKIAEAINASTTFNTTVSAAFVAPDSFSLTSIFPGTVGNAITFDTNNVVEIDPGVAVPTTFAGGLDGFGASLVASADSSGRLVFTFQKASYDTSGILEFISDATAAEDFAVLSGVDTSTAFGTQTKLYDGPIARRFTVGSAPLSYDRLVMRSRILPGSGTIAAEHAVAQTGITVQGVPDAKFVGVISQQKATADFSACLKPATILAPIGMSGGQDTGGQPAISFYDGTGTAPANNVFKFVHDGVSVTVVFASSSTGTLTGIGPASTAGTVINQIAASMASAGIAANTAAVLSSGLILQEGAGFRINSGRSDQFSSLTIGEGVANSVLSLSGGLTALRTSTPTTTLSSALMGHAPSGSFTDFIHDFANPPAGYFSAEALAGISEDVVGGQYLFLQSQTTGVSSSVFWDAAASKDILSRGTLLLAKVGEGATGEAGGSGFFVTSSDPSDGSGTANTSKLNSGTGQDGVVGQTYRDAVTGLTFTVLPREGGLAYPSGGQFFLTASSTFTTDGNIPTLAVPGVELLVTNTTGVTSGDTSAIETFERGGSEPPVGGIYYVSYSYLKQDFRQQIFTRLRAIEDNFGEVSPNNPLSLASFLALINGAVAVGMKQVPKNEDGVATSQSFKDALDELETTFTGGIQTDIIVPLYGNIEDTEFWDYLSLHLDLQSSLRYRAERTAIVGFTPVVRTEDVGALAERIKSTRFRIMYPDSGTLSLTNSLGQTEEYLVEGFHFAAAMAGSVADPSLDVAQPWTGRNIRGFNRLGVVLSPVDANILAQRGVTIITEEGTNLKIRQGLTTDMENVLTRTPTVIQIVDEVHKRARQTLSPFIGNKYLPGITSDIESRIISMFQRLVREQIVTAFTGVRAEPNPDDPTAATVEAAYQPVFPLLYILLTFNLRASGI